MAIPQILTSFRKGEVAPELWGSVDLAPLHAGAATMRNMYPNYRGGAMSRAGFCFVGKCKQDASAAHPRLIPFNFSISQSYALEFGDNYMRPIYRGAYITETPIDITGASQADPCAISISGTPFGNGDWVFMSGVNGMTELNNQTYIVANSVSGSFTLIDIFSGLAVDSTNFGAYTFGGTAARLFTLSTPYLAADLPFLKFTQSADVMSLTHPNYPTFDLARINNANWTLTQTSFAATINPPTNATATTSAAGTTRYQYVVTAVDKTTGAESIASNAASVSSVDIAVTAGTITITWDAVTSAGSYNVFQAPPDVGGSSVPVGSLFGYVGTSLGNSFADSNITADFTRVPPTHQNPFAVLTVLDITMTNQGSLYTTATVSITSSAGTGFVGTPVIIGGKIQAILTIDGGENYDIHDTLVITGDGSGAAGTLTIGPSSGTSPGAVAYFQQRRFYAATLNQPDTYFASKPGNFTDFDTSIPVQDDDAITGTPWSQQVNGIQFMVPMPFGLVIFTGLGAWQLSGGNQQTAVTPADQTATPQGQIGCSPIVPPIVINQDILFVQSKGSIVRDLRYNFFVNLYEGNDTTVISSHLFQNHEIKEWAWAEEPYKIIWSVRDDGILLSQSWLKEQEVNGWARHDTQGIFESICVTSEPVAQCGIVSGAVPPKPAQHGMIDLGAPPIIAFPPAVVLDMSSDGSVLVGRLSIGGTSTAAFYWTAETDIVEIPMPVVAETSSALYVSSDGLTIAGTYQTFSSDFRSFIWTAALGPVDLGDLGGSNSVTALSTDGSTAVGNSNGFGYRWTRSGGIVSMGTFAGGSASSARAVSSDGSVIAGNSNAAAGWTHAYRWTLAGGLVDIDTLSGIAFNAFSVAEVMTPDGSVIAGRYEDFVVPASGTFRWTATGMVNIGQVNDTIGKLTISDDGSVIAGENTLTTAIERWTQATGIVTIADGGGFGTFVEAISGDGTTLAGEVRPGVGANCDIMRWTQAGGIQDLGTLAGPSIANVAFAVSSDGSVLGGGTSDPAFRWTQATGLVALALPPTSFSTAVAISADGTVIIGREDATATETVAFMWTASSGRVTLGDLGGGFSEALFVSPNGSVIVGVSAVVSTDNHAFRWTQAGGMVDLGTLAGGFFSQPNGMSADGSVIVGVADNAISDAAFKWTAGGGMVDLGTLGGSASEADGISADGLVIVGNAYLAGDAQINAFRWTSGGGMVDIGNLGGNSATALFASSDGSVVVGTSFLAGNTVTHLFRWTSGTGMVDLGTLGSDISPTQPTGISADGSVIVGFSRRADFFIHAFRWTQATGMVDLGALDGTFSEAKAVSVDGSVVVGSGGAFRWTQATGMVDLGTLGGISAEALAVSANGDVVVGDSNVVDGAIHAFRWS